MYFARPGANEHTRPLLKINKEIKHTYIVISREQQQRIKPSVGPCVTTRVARPRNCLSVPTQYMNISTLTPYPHAHTQKQMQLIFCIRVIITGENEKRPQRGGDAKAEDVKGETVLARGCGWEEAARAETWPASSVLLLPCPCHVPPAKLASDR